MVVCPLADLIGVDIVFLDPLIKIRGSLLGKVPRKMPLHIFQLGVRQLHCEEIQNLSLEIREGRLHETGCSIFPDVVPFHTLKRTAVECDRSES